MLFSKKKMFFPQIVEGLSKRLKRYVIKRFQKKPEIVYEN